MQAELCSQHCLQGAVGVKCVAERCCAASGAAQPRHQQPRNRGRDICIGERAVLVVLHVSAHHQARLIAGTFAPRCRRRRRRGFGVGATPEAQGMLHCDLHRKQRF
eukprot:342454-Chlamydomonas_euryale.AAC.1